MATGGLSLSASSPPQMELHHLSLVVENVQLPFDVRFSIAIRLPSFDWCLAGSFHRGVLPAGSTCTFNPSEECVPLTEINVDMKLECQSSVYSGTLNVEKEPGKAGFSVHGVTVLFREDDPQEMLFIAVLLTAEPVLLTPPPLTSTESQTDDVRMKSTSCQALRPKTRSRMVETRGRVVEERALQEAVIRIVQINLEREKERRQRRAPRHPPDPIQPATQNLGWNVVPRLQKLSVLDQMIGNRERLLGAMDSTLQHSEVRKKMEFIRSQRRTKKEWVEEDGGQEMAEETGEVLKKEENLEEETSKDQESSEVTSSSANSSPGSVSNRETSISSSSSGSSSAKKEEKVPSSSSSIEDPFSPHLQKPNQLSPTSEYIQNLRKEILRERMNP